MRLKSDQTPFRGLPPAVDASGSYHPVSLWQETVPVTPGSPLESSIECDVAVVGGGFTGLSVAYHLKKYAPGIEVVLIERDVIGHGASGRNGGFAMPLLGWDLLYAAQKLGEQQAGAAYRLMYDAVDHVKRTVAEHAIDCDLEATGYLLLNTCARREKRARREYEVAHRLGFDHQWLDKAGVGEHIRADTFRSGVLDPRPCILNPAKLARGMKGVVERLGVRVYEQTPLDELIDGLPVRLRTPHGAVNARQVVLALNGYGGSIGFMQARVMPVHTYIVATEPLTNDQLASTGWHVKRTSLETARNFIHYFRLTADNRILFGGEDAQLYYGDQYKDQDQIIFTALQGRFREYFPTLRDVRFTHQWGGVLGVTLDMFPTFGAGGDHGSVYHAAGYSGHGVALSNYAGAILAPQILKSAGVRDIPDGPQLPFFYNRKPVWLASGPVRYVGLQAYRQALRLQDKWDRA
ncbi:MAG: FAD-binding oxidoreductase [Candidatus Hydrogenedentes bacterium]|nr:FAD-binding oxidoreductase [Candidatus Hydrogenedentota bacterium]